jgi:hypothetical protein
MKQLIRDFLKKYCTIVKDDDSIDYFNIMIDNHYYIRFEDVDWFVQEDNPLWNEDEQLLQAFIISNYEKY